MSGARILSLVLFMVCANVLGAQGTRARPFEGSVSMRATLPSPNGVQTQVMEYLTRTHVPVTWALADKYTTCDRWFAAVMGPTLPNRAYWHCATSFGQISIHRK